MADTTVITFTFTDTAALEACWEDYCTKAGLSFTDAADAETKAVQHIKDTAVSKIAGYRADPMGEAERASVYATEAALIT